MAGEEVFYQDDKVTVTSSRFVVGATMYPTRNISSVTAEEAHVPPARGFSIFVGLLAAIVGLFAVAGQSPVAGGFAVVMLGGAVMEWRKKQALHSYSIAINFLNERKRAFTTNDKSLRDKVLDAVHRSVAGG